jgi:hypothetical protein
MTEQQKQFERTISGVEIQADTPEEFVEKAVEVIERDFREEIAKVKAKYGDAEPPTLMEISAEAWAEAFAEAKSARVMAVARQLGIIGELQRWMREYTPQEAVAAILDFDENHRHDTIDSFLAVHGWMGRVIEEYQDRALREG